MADLTYDGRKPAFDRRGEIRGFRTKPGAPLADQTSNNPLSQNGGTTKSNWDTMFRNSLTGNNPLSPEARASAVPPQPSISQPQPQPSAVDTAMAEITKDEQFGGGVNQPPPSLSILSAGGPTHAQTWGGDSLAKKYSAFGANVQDIPTVGGIQRTAKSKYGWGSSYFST